MGRGVGQPKHRCWFTRIENLLTIGRRNWMFEHTRLGCRLTPRWCGAILPNLGVNGNRWQMLGAILSKSYLSDDATVYILHMSCDNTRHSCVHDR